MIVLPTNQFGESMPYDQCRHLFYCLPAVDLCHIAPIDIAFPHLPALVDYYGCLLPRWINSLLPYYRYCRSDLDLCIFSRFVVRVRLWIIVSFHFCYHKMDGCAVSVSSMCLYVCLYNRLDFLRNDKVRVITKLLNLLNLLNLVNF